MVKPLAPRFDTFGVDHEPETRFESGEPLGETDQAGGFICDTGIWQRQLEFEELVCGKRVSPVTHRDIFTSPTPANLPGSPPRVAAQACGNCIEEVLATVGVTVAAMHVAVLEFFTTK